MKYALQIQQSLERLDQSLLALNRIIKNGQLKEALDYMEQGPLKERFEELQNVINLENKDSLGANGVSQTKAF